MVYSGALSGVRMTFSKNPAGKKETILLSIGRSVLDICTFKIHDKVVIS